MAKKKKWKEKRKKEKKHKLFMLPTEITKK